MNTMYACEYCGTEYDVEEDAADCETACDEEALQDWDDDEEDYGDD